MGMKREILQQHKKSALICEEDISMHEAHNKFYVP
jgi:hypothetical protein